MLQYALSFKRRSPVLFYCYVPLLLIFAAVGFDLLFLRGQIRANLPSSHYDIFIFSYIFSTPHIFASAIIYLDKEYIRHFRPQLLKGLGLITLYMGVAYFYFPADVFQSIHISLTLLHILFQQYGLISMVSKTPWHSFWRSRWICLVAIILFSINHNVVGGNEWLSNICMVVAVLGGGIFTYLDGRSIQDLAGKALLYSNWVIVVASCGLKIMEYPLFGYLCWRAVHDFTAFAIYTNHNKNRNSAQPKNFFFKPLALLGVPWVVSTVLVSIVLAAPVTYLKLEFILLFAGYFHYWTDRFSWRKTSPMAQALNM